LDPLKQGDYLVRTMPVVVMAATATLMGSSMAFAFSANTSSTLPCYLHTKSTFVDVAYYHTHIQNYSSGTRRNITRYDFDRYYIHRPHVHY
jgi:hypothetical protein